jgi:pimeloyl-ACP methyl ester carboxylesterase
LVTREAGEAARERLLRDLPVTERRLDVDEIMTSVLEGGQGPPMVLLHGGAPAGGVVWGVAPVMPRLAQSHRLVVPDLPGLGESKPFVRLDPAAFNDWFAGLLRLTCQEKPTLVAHSLPASLAARFAAQFGDRIRRLVLMGTPALGRYRPPPAFMLAGLRMGLRPSEANLARFNRWAFHDLDRTQKALGEPFEALNIYSLSRAVIPHVKRTMRQLVKAGTKQIPEPDLRRIEIPTALVWGRQDRMGPLSSAEAASSRLGWPLFVIDDAGHIPPAEQPDAFLGALATAIGEEEPN